MLDVLYKLSSNDGGTGGGKSKVLNKGNRIYTHMTFH